MAILVDTQIRNDLYASGSITAEEGFTGSLLGSASFAYTSSYVNCPIGNIFFVSSSAVANATSSIFSIITSSFRGCFLNYVVDNGADLRGGNLNTVWSGSETHYFETQTTDFGNTEPINWNFLLTGDTISFKIENASEKVYQIKATVMNI